MELLSYGKVTTVEESVGGLNWTVICTLAYIFHFSLQTKKGVAMEKRPALEESDALVFGIAEMLAGREIPGIPRSQSDVEGFISGVMEMFATYPGDPETVAKHTLSDLQCRLMAFRKDDFTTIQKEAPFSRQGMANLVSLLSAYREGGKNKVVSKYRELKKSGKMNAHDNEIITYSGGNGEFRGQAVVIHAQNSFWGVAAEYWYLNYTYGTIEPVDSVTLRGAYTREDPGKVYDQVGFRTYEGELKHVFFNVTEFARLKAPTTSVPTRTQSEATTMSSPSGTFQKATFWQRFTQWLQGLLKT